MRDFKYLNKLQALSITCILTSLVLAHKMVTIFNVQFSVASLIFPNTMLIANIIAIVYGYSYSSEVMWETLKCQIPFTVICFIAIKLPSSVTQSNLAYEYVFKDMWQISIASLIGTYIGLKANIYMLSKFNLFLFYKGFWLRTLFACGIGEFVFTLFALPLMFFNKVHFTTLLSMILISLFVKLVYSSFLSYFSQIIAVSLMKREKINYDQSSINYDPFILKAFKDSQT